MRTPHASNADAIAQMAPFAGKIHSMRFYDRMLTSEECGRIFFRATARMWFLRQRPT